MRLFIHPASPNCVAALAVARRLRSELDIRHVDLFSGEHRNPEFLTLNPNGLVPVLRDGDFVLWETVAILEYLGSLEPTHFLLPIDLRQRADVLRWMAWGLAHWNPSLQPFIFERMFKPMKGLGASDEQRLASIQPKLDQAAALLDTALERPGYLCGDHLTLADYFLAAYPMYALKSRINLTPYENLSRWLDHIHSLEEWHFAIGEKAN
ncbi:MAG: glutathione S-transferase family protein [Hyphomicrobiales bacterium]|nr:glutathione S-transferase family protein [Hyphomicrobiales bacterium]